MKGKWLYDIILPVDNRDYVVGNQGDYEFDTKEEAKADADDYIINLLATEHNVNEDAFRVECYQAQY